MCFYFFYRKLSLKEALDYLEEILSDEDDDMPTSIFIEPPNETGDLSGEDDAIEDAIAIPDNLCSGQLKEKCKVVFSSEVVFNECFLH